MIISAGVSATVKLCMFYLLSQRVSSLDCFMKSNSRSHHQHLIRVRLPHNLGLAHSEDLVIGIDHRGGGPADSEEADLGEKQELLRY